MEECSAHSGHTIHKAAMGNVFAQCCGEGAKYVRYGGGSGPSSLGKAMPDTDRAIATWKTTGIVGLRDRNLSELPDSVAQVGADAKVLDGTGNKLKAFPEVVESLPCLQRLILAQNIIRSIPGSILLPLVDLKILVLDSNSLASLPDEIGALKSLEKLSLKNNQLSSLNPSVGSLTSLRFLLLASNQLAELPDMGGLAALEELDASSNAITKVTPTLGACQKLKTLNLDNNQVLAVSREIGLSPWFACMRAAGLNMPRPPSPGRHVKRHLTSLLPFFPSPICRPDPL